MNTAYVPPTLAESGSVGISELRGKYAGLQCYIVGKGPSLQYLRASDFAPGCPVVTINQAIEVVQVLGLPNPIWAMQKDGCDQRDEHGARPCGSCAEHGWKRSPVFDPFPGINVLMTQHLSSWCLHGRERRYVATDEELGYPGLPLTMSVLEAIPFAKHLGAASITMVSFDSLTTGDLETAFASTNITRFNLEWVRPHVLRALTAFGPHSFYTPMAREVAA